MAIWGVFDFLLLGAAGVTLAFSFIWRSVDPFRNLVIPQSDLTFGMVVGLFYGITFMVSVGAIIQRNHVTIGLVALNWLLLLDTILTVALGSTLWFMTLNEQANFEDVWINAPRDTKIAVQDQLQCCGYRDKSNWEIGGQVCRDVATADTMRGCMEPFLEQADTMLMNTFTTVYSFTAILVALFVTTLCVMKKRQEQERFRKIDAKRGGRGFV